MWTVNLKNFIAGWILSLIIVITASGAIIVVNPGESIQAGIDFGLTVGGSISGTVRDANGNAISNLWVVASDYDTGSWSNGDYTDVNGVYEIEKLPAGIYRVCASTWDTDYVEEYYDNQIRWDRATPVSVLDEQVTGNIDFSLEPGASISGFIKDIAGEAVGDVQVDCSVEDIYYAYGYTTDSNGFYEARRLPAGYEYRVVAYPPSSTDYMIAKIYVDVPEVDDYMAEDIILQGGALTVSGTVTEKATGAALVDIWISCNLKELDVWGGGLYTDVNGFYRLTNLPPGKVEIRAEPQLYYAHIGTELELAEDINDLDFALPIEAVLSGKVLDTVTAEPLAGIEVEYWCDRYRIGKNDCTGSDGVFELTNLPPDMAEIRTQPEFDTGYAWNPPWGGNRICLDEGEHRSNRIIALHKGAPVTGCIKDVNGIVMSGVKYEWMGKMCEGWGLADVNGHYQIRLPLGDYVITQSEDELCALVARVTITDTNQPVNVNDIIVYSEETGGQISGNVNNPGGYSKQGEFVVFALEGGTEIGPHTWYTIRPIGESVFGQAGPFTVTALPPDANYDVHLCVVSETMGEIESVAMRDVATNIGVGTTGINLDYSSEGSTVDGNVINTYGRAVIGATVLLDDPCTGAFAGFGETDSNGVYVVYNVAAGTYNATAVHSKYANASTTIEVVEGMSANVGTIVMPFSGDKEGADLNGNGIINMGDVAKFGNEWRQSGSLDADFDQDGEVGASDLARLVEYWLWRAIWPH